MSTSGTFSTTSNGTHISEVITHDPNVGDTYSRVDSTVVAAQSGWTRSSTNTPGYNSSTRRLRKHKGIDLPMNPFGFSKTAYSGRYGTIYSAAISKLNGAYTAYQDSGYWDSNIPVPAKDPDVFARLDSKARNKLLGKLHDQSVNLGNAIGEGKQTVNLFLQTAGRLAGAAKDLRRGNISGAAQILTGLQQTNVDLRGRRILHSNNTTFARAMRLNSSRALANGWLELQYGWMPLLSDIYGSCEFLANKLYRAPRFKESASSSVSTSYTVRTDISVDAYVLDAFETVHAVKYVNYFSQEGQHDLAAIGLINPLSIAWELTPWSFVVDWMLPIGTFLNNLDATYGLEFKKGCRTEFWRASCKRRQYGKSYEIGNVKYVNTSNVSERVDKVFVSRDRVSSFPSNPLPNFKNPFSQFKSLIDPGAHALNAMALLTQAFGR